MDSRWEMVTDRGPHVDEARERFTIAIQEIAQASGDPNFAIGVGFNALLAYARQTFGDGYLPHLLEMIGATTQQSETPEEFDEGDEFGEAVH